ncbi:MAG: GIY-YIG nuclease family protein [Rhodospirillales bacterium]
MGAFLYILKCQDSRYYVGTTRGSLERRIEEHNAGAFGGYTAVRRPVELAFYQEFDRIEDAIAMERRVKGWSRAKKEALMRGDFEMLRQLGRRQSLSRSSFETAALPPPQDEE